MNLPDCPECDAANTLQRYGAEVQGMTWTNCTACAATVLVRILDSAIIRIGKR